MKVRCHWEENCHQVEQPTGVPFDGNSPPYVSWHRTVIHYNNVMVCTSRRYNLDVVVDINGAHRHCACASYTAEPEAVVLALRGDSPWR